MPERGDGAYRKFISHFAGLRGVPQSGAAPIEASQKCHIYSAIR
jgi:hypothetical protein